MAGGLNRLNDKQTRSLGAGKHADGGGLYLVVTASGLRKWAFLYTVDGKRKEMGLGGLVKVSLANARKKAAEARDIVGRGGDPLAICGAQKSAEKAKAEGAQSFGVYADAWFEQSVAPGLSNPKHADQWRMTLTHYCEAIRSKPVAEISTADVLSVLQPIWLTIPETAQRLRGRIERVLDAATVTGARDTTMNPARWKGHLDKLLTKPVKLKRGHHPAMPWQDVPAFVAKLREREAVTARALEFLILTCGRCNETLGARWQEFDLDAMVWTVPASRMKLKKIHRVPITAAMLVILNRVRPLTGGEAGALVFPGQRPNKPYSHAALEALRERIGVAPLMVEGVAKEVTTHGFRSSFRDWAGEATSAPREVAEGCLAHATGSAVELSYRRGDALEKRRALLEQWAAFIDGRSGADVVDFGLNKAGRGK